MKQICAQYSITAVFILCVLLAGRAQASAEVFSAVAINSVSQEQTPTEDDGPCAAAYLMGSESPDLATLRMFRDGVLAKTALGQKMTEIYYAKSGSLIALFETSPTLKSYAGKVLKAVMPAIKTMLGTQ